MTIAFRKEIEKKQGEMEQIQGSRGSMRASNANILSNEYSFTIDIHRSMTILKRENESERDDHTELRIYPISTSDRNKIGRNFERFRLVL